MALYTLIRQSESIANDLYQLIKINIYTWPPKDIAKTVYDNIVTCHCCIIAVSEDSSINREK